MNQEEQDDRPFDEILAEILWRAYELKKKAQENLEDKSITKRIIRWFYTGRN